MRSLSSCTRVVLTFLVDGDIAGLDQRGAIGAEQMTLSGRPGPPSMSTATVSKTAWLIWQAMVRFQISEYSTMRIVVQLARELVGRRGGGMVGRIASCASCAFFDLVL